MSINKSSDNQLYQIYANSGPTPSLIIPAALFFFVGYSGVIMNAFVVFVTFKTKPLHGTAYFLIAMICTFEIFHQSGHAIFFTIALSGINFISTFLAARLNVLMLFGLNCALVGMVCAAFDRFLAMISTHFHRTLKKKIYLGVHILVCFFYGARCCFYVIQFYTIQDTNSPATGCISELLSGPVGEIFFRDTAILNALAAIFYISLWFVTRCRKATKETNSRLLKSLVIILVVNIGAYFVTLAIYQILFHIPPGTLDPVLIWHLGFISGVLLNICAGCNAIVLYKSSTDYRKAFKYHLSKFLPKIGLPSPVGWSNQILALRTTQVQNPQQHSVGGGANSVGTNNTKNGAGRFVARPVCGES